jgi:hypothetical protein
MRMNLSYRQSKLHPKLLYLDTRKRAAKRRPTVRKEGQMKSWSDGVRIEGDISDRV